MATHIEKVTHILSALNYEQSQRIFKKELRRNSNIFHYRDT